MILIAIILVMCLSFTLGVAVGKSGERANFADCYAKIAEREEQLIARERVLVLEERKRIGSGREYLSNQ